MEEHQGNAAGRQELDDWQEAASRNSYSSDPDFKHTLAFYLPKRMEALDPQLEKFAETVIRIVEPLVKENNLPQNLPRIERYDGIGRRSGKVVHHPAYETIGNLIYGSGLMEKIARKGGLLEGLAFLFLSSQVGEAGHNCPIACSAGVIRVLQKAGDFPQKKFFLQKLTAPSFTENFTGAQFVTEVQGGSDAGRNAAVATKDEEGHWRITGEKWFCSNANADLILMTARYDPDITGTKGLGLFLVPAELEPGKGNHYTLRRLKDKLGTRSMATAEIDFHGARAIPMGEPEEGFKLLMENVLHISRLFNAVVVTGMGRRALQIASDYAKNRSAFGRPIADYPLVRENLARIKVENTALMAGVFSTLSLQDASDVDEEKADAKLLNRILANINKYLTALWSVEHIHHCLDVLAGNGTIETFSTLPLLLRDCIICENWEGTHNVLRMQILRDILRYDIDKIFLNHIQTLFEEIEPDDRLKRFRKKLQENLEKLRQSSPELQALMSKKLVDQMGVLYCACCLRREALDQRASGSESKMRSYEYFCVLRMGEALEDQRYLELISSVLE